MAHKTKQQKHQGAGGLGAGPWFNPSSFPRANTELGSLQAIPALLTLGLLVASVCGRNKDRVSEMHRGLSSGRDHHSKDTLVWGHHWYCGTVARVIWPLYLSSNRFLFPPATVPIEAKELRFVNDLLLFYKLKQSQSEQHSDFILTLVSWCVFLNRRGSITAGALTLRIPRGVGPGLYEPQGLPMLNIL